MDKIGQDTNEIRSAKKVSIDRFNWSIENFVIALDKISSRPHFSVNTKNKCNKKLNRVEMES